MWQWTWEGISYHPTWFNEFFQQRQVLSPSSNLMSQSEHLSPSSFIPNGQSTILLKNNSTFFNFFQIIYYVTYCIHNWRIWKNCLSVKPPYYTVLNVQYKPHWYVHSLTNLSVNVNYFVDTVQFAQFYGNQSNVTST